MNKPPFYYEFRFNLISFDKENNMKHEVHRRQFKTTDLLQNRRDAFDYFNSWIADLKEHGRIKIDERGNYYITQPNFKNKNQEFEQFKEDISIFIIVEDENYIQKKKKEAREYWERIGIDLSTLLVGNTIPDKYEYEIHKVASYFLFEVEQDLLDNLHLTEIELYNFYNVDISNHTKIVSHYGYDWSSNKEEGSEKYEILETPYIWQTLEEYNKYIITFDDEVEEDENKPQSLASYYKEIINRGESHQVEFKSSLLYNFNTGKAGISVKYIIAKTICSFLNSDGGVLLVGVRDNGDIQGLDYDYSLFPDKENLKDEILKQVDSLIAYFLSFSIMPLLNCEIVKIDNKDVLVVLVNKSENPVLLTNRRDGVIKNEIFVRLNASTHEYRIDNGKDIKDMIEYFVNRARQTDLDNAN